MSEPIRSLRIGEVAARAGVRVDTVRFYERRGLLPRAPRRRSGYRMFDGSTVERIQLTKRAQALGFSLDEITVLLRAVDEGRATCASTHRSLEDALRRVDTELTRLRALRRQLSATLRGCRSGDCTVVEQAARRWAHHR